MYGMSLLTNKLHVEIDLETWLRGEGGNGSKLRTKEGKQCCLGFKLCADGFTKKQITDKMYPAAVCKSNHSWLTKEDGRDSMLASFAAAINDVKLGKPLFLGDPCFAPLGNLTKFVKLCDNMGKVSPKFDDNEFTIIRTDKERQKIIKKIFAAGGDEVIFINKKPLDIPPCVW